MNLEYKLLEIYYEIIKNNDKILPIIEYTGLIADKMAIPSNAVNGIFTALREKGVLKLTGNNKLLFTNKGINEIKANQAPEKLTNEEINILLSSRLVKKD